MKGFKLTLRQDQVKHMLLILAWVKEQHRQRRSGGDIDVHAHHVAQTYIEELEGDIRMQCGDVSKP